MGSKNQTSTATSSPNPAALSAYTDILSRAQQVAQSPYNPYTGQLVPEVNAQQTLGISNINQNANYAQPYIQNAAGLATSAATPLTSADIQQYVNPWTQNVVNATQAEFNNQNQQQLQQVKGNAIAQNALGGNREGIAEAITSGQQNLAQAPVIAGLESQGYQTGVNTALAEQQAKAQGAYSLGNLGVSGQNAALTGANAQVGAGNLQYGVASAQDQAAYQQFLNQQAFPYQQTQWLAGIGTGVGSQLGGISTTTQPGPTLFQQIAGLGIAGAGAYGAYTHPGANRGGRIEGFAMGGTPYSGGVGYIPEAMAIADGRGAPPPPGSGNQGGQGNGLNAGSGASLGNLAGGIRNFSNGYNLDGTASGDQWVQAGQGQGVYAPIDTSYGDSLGIGHAARGGRIGFADGGAPIMTAEGLATIPDWLGDAQYSPPSDSDYFPQPMSHPVPTTSYRQGVAPDVIPDGSINAPDIVLNAGPGGYGAGVAYEPDNNATYADRRYTANGDVLPPEITQGTSHPTAGVAPSSGALGYAGSPSYGDTNVPSSTPTTYEHPTTSPWGAIIAAGLGMAASRSPWALQAAAEGGLGGLREYSAEQAQNISEAEKKATIGIESQRLEQAAKRAQDDLNLRTQEFYGKPLTIDTDPNTLRPEYGVPDPQNQGQFLDPRTHLPFPPRKNPSDIAPLPETPGAPKVNSSIAPMGAHLETANPGDMIISGPPKAQSDPAMLAQYQLPQYHTAAMRQSTQEGNALNKKVDATDTIQFKSNEMSHSLDTIESYIKSNPNSQAAKILMTPGPLGDDRLKLLNAWASVPGNKAPQEVVSAINVLAKDSVTSGFAQIGQSGLSSREAQPIIQASMNAMASFNLPIDTSRAIIASMKASSDMVRDQKAFFDDYKNKNGGIATGWWDAFNEQNPPQKYVAKALYSQLNPQQQQDIGTHVNEIRQARDAFISAEQSQDAAAMNAARQRYDIGLRNFNAHYKGLGNYFLYGTM
jgi:hypothetical protein